MNKPEYTSESPLTQAKPDSLNELMERDPLHLSGTGLEQVVEDMRSHRKKFEDREANAVLAGRGKRMTRDIPMGGLTSEMLRHGDKYYDTE